VQDRYATQVELAVLAQVVAHVAASQVAAHRHNLELVHHSLWEGVAARRNLWEGVAARRSSWGVAACRSLWEVVAHRNLWVGEAVHHSLWEVVAVVVVADQTWEVWGAVSSGMKQGCGIVVREGGCWGCGIVVALSQWGEGTIWEGGYLD
jgi:hypothetical protein